MGDFAQFGSVRTLHHLRSAPPDHLVSELTRLASDVPMSLVIPTLYQELERQPLQTMVEQLASVPYLGEVIIGLDGADAEEFAKAKAFFASLPMRHRVLWNDGPRLRAVDAELARRGLTTRRPGKGRNVWYCLGFFLGSGRGDVVAFHDADISTYSTDMVARLLYPIADPALGYHFAKGYYYRSDETTLNGRVARLLIAPLVDALRSVVGPSGYLDYLGGFRYPLAGEFAITREVASELRTPDDWGVEIGILNDVHRRLDPARICQVDIADRYDHKHQPLSADDPGAGLHKMAIDIVGALLRHVRADGHLLDRHRIDDVGVAFLERADDLIEVYHHDAIINGLSTDREREREIVDVFATSIAEAGEAFSPQAELSPPPASWSSVAAGWPDVFEALVSGVDADV